jgi:hypothetical protein
MSQRGIGVVTSRRNALGGCGAARREVEERTQEVVSFQRELALSATRDATSCKEVCGWR